MVYSDLFGLERQVWDISTSEVGLLGSSVFIIKFGIVSVQSNTLEVPIGLGYLVVILGGEDSGVEIFIFLE